MGNLVDRVMSELPLTLKRSLNSQGKIESYLELPDEGRWRMVAKVVPLGDDRAEITVRKANLQRVIDSAQMVRPRGRRLERLERDPEDIARAAKRAQKSVRHLCQLHKVDRMLTFGTRATIELSVLLTRYQRFARAYERRAGRGKFNYVAVPEPHADGVHWHLHVAIAGWFELQVALSIWHALCAGDDEDHLVNGSINVKTFRVRNATEDIVSIIAGYIAKYVGKSLEAAFNKKSYWATRVERDETQFHILDSDTPEAALQEVCVKWGVDVRSIVMTHEGCFFPLFDLNGFWIKLTPEMHRTNPF